MPDSTILNLAQGATPDGTEWVPAVQGGQNVRLNFPGTAQQITVDNGSFTTLTSTDVQGALSEVDTALTGAAALPILLFESVSHKNATNYTTTSSTLTAIDDTNLPITITLVAGDEVVLDFTAPFGIASVGNIIGVDWAVDVPTGTDVVGIAVDAGAYASASFQIGNGGSDSTTRTAKAKFVAVVSGSHIFKPRWRVGGGTTASIKQASAENYETPIVHTALIKRG